MYNELKQKERFSVIIGLLASLISFFIIVLITFLPKLGSFYFLYNVSIFSLIVSLVFSIYLLMQNNLYMKNRGIMLFVVDIIIVLFLIHDFFITFS